MNAKTLFATPSRSRGYIAADMATASADGWRAGQAADNELLSQCRLLLQKLSPLNTAQPSLAVEVRATLEALDERLA